MDFWDFPYDRIVTSSGRWCMNRTAPEPAGRNDRRGGASDEKRHALCGQCGDDSLRLRDGAVVRACESEIAAVCRISLRVFIERNLLLPAINAIGGMLLQILRGHIEKPPFDESASI